jgi:hypothetical protein
MCIHFLLWQLSTIPRVKALGNSNDCPRRTIVSNYVAIVYMKAETSSFI